MNLQQAWTDASLKSMNHVHRLILRASGGRLLASAFGMPAIELRTTGRKSGLQRTTMLTSPVMDGSRVVLVASKGGDDRDPDWFRNLLAQPDAELTVVATGENRKVRARVATPEEKAELWPRAVSAYSGYAGYQRRTQRDIPLVICEPRR